MTYTYDPALNIPDFLKREKHDAPKKMRAPRRTRRVRVSTPKPPKTWRDAAKVRVVVGAGWPRSFPAGNRVCLVLRGKTKRSKFVRVREWPCYYGVTHKVARDVFESSVVGETK